MMNRYVGHYISGFLPITEVWIYHLLKNHRLYKPLTFCRRIINSELFSIPELYSLKNLSFLQWAYNFTIFKTVGYFPYFKNICEQKRCDVIHAHFGYNAYKTVKLAQSLKKPLICSFYGGDVYKYPANSGNRLKYRRLFKAMSRGIVLGPYMKQSLIDLGCPEEKLLINHLGVDVENIKYQPRNYSGNKPVRFLIASGFLEKKGIDIALKAMKGIENNIDFRLEIVGDGPLKEQILSLVNTLKLNKKVVFHGYRPYHYFIRLAYSCDAFIQASRTAKDNDREGTPMAIIDAMATGLPVISTLHSDIPELVDDGITGFLAEENSVESLMDACIRLIDKSNELQSLSKNCRAKIDKEFNLQKQVENLEQIYLSTQ